MRALGHNNQRKMFALASTVRDLGADALIPKGNLGNQDDVVAASVTARSALTNVAW